MPIPFPKHGACEDDRWPRCTNAGSQWVLLPDRGLGGRIFWLCTDCTSSQPPAWLNVEQFLDVLAFGCSPL